MRGKVGNIFLIIGLCLLLFAGGIWLNNERQANEAYDKSNIALKAIKKDMSGDSVAYRLYPDMDMPVVKHEGKGYIGVLSFPGLELELPILAKYNEDDLMISPCAYYGTIYDHHMVIAGHNYSRHFGKLGLLKINDEIRFEDVKKNLFRYKVVAIEQLHQDQNELLINSDADLTLFTCTLTRVDRIVVRCRLIEDIPYKKN